RRDQGPHFDDVADRPRVSEQGSRRRRVGDHAWRETRIRNHQTRHHPRYRRWGRGLTDPEHYSPQLRTAVVFSGTGTAGAYHAGVLRARNEAGVKMDVAAGRGMGALAALFAAIDGGQKLWGENAFWDSDAVKTLYEWRSSLKLAAWAVAASLGLVVIPLG